MQNPVKDYLKEERMIERSQKEIAEIIGPDLDKELIKTWQDYYSGKTNNKTHYDKQCLKINKTPAFDLIKCKYMPILEKTLEYILQNCCLYNNTIIDVGCGTGLELAFIAQYSPKKLIGIDISKEMLKETRNRMQKRNITNFSLIQADRDNIPIDSSKVDLLLCLNSLIDANENNYNEIALNYITGERIKKFRNILKKQGNMILVNPFDHQSKEFRRYEIEKMLFRIEYSGLTNINHLEIDFVDKDKIEHNYALFSAKVK